MFPKIEDFKIGVENFNLGQGMNILRIICGLFMFPHAMSKFAGGVINPGIVGFFAKAGFTPPELWVYLAFVSEVAVGIALVLGLCTRFAALGAAGVLAIAVYALHVTKGFVWLWNLGGYEYPVFWAIASLAVALEAWKAHFSPIRR